MPEKKSAIIARSDDVTTTSVGEHMCASHVEVGNHATGAAVTIRARHILSVDGWENAGLRSHPDERFIDKIILGTIYSVNIKYNGPHVSHVSDNWKSAYILRDFVINSLHRDVKLGRKAGPFRQPPFENFVVSPMGAFKRKRSDLMTFHGRLAVPSMTLSPKMTAEWTIYQQTRSLTSSSGQVPVCIWLDWTSLTRISIYWCVQKIGIYSAPVGQTNKVRPFIILIKPYPSGFVPRPLYSHNLNH